MSASRVFACISVVIALGAAAAMAEAYAAPASSGRPELEYLKAVNRAGPSQDPQLLFLLMGQYANANLHREGAEQISALLHDFEPYLVMRENVINRIFHQNVGYWQPDLQGMDALGRADGKHELAASVLDGARDRYPDSARLEALERLAYAKLAEKYQEFNPFKLIVYSGKGGFDIPPVTPADRARSK